jgi:hypothetical protein
MRSKRVSVQRRSGHEVRRLIERLKKLVAQQRQLEDDASSEQRKANRLEIARLQRRLALLVKRELTSS